MSGDSYSGWLGGYAKSVAGSVSAFTQDILDETRQDTQGTTSLGAHWKEREREREREREIMKDRRVNI